MKTFKVHDVEFRGQVRRVEYTTANKEGELLKKYVNVYVPYGYDEDPEKKYNILYLMHGGGGNPDAWLDASAIKNELDHAFMEKEAEPFIVAFPTYYEKGAKSDKNEHSPAGDGEKVLAFQKELREAVIPAVEGTVRTYADTTDFEGLKASRKHRGFGGFSMGSVTTWYAFLCNLDIIADFLPLSGDCWVVETMGGNKHPEETAEKLCESVKEKGYTKDDFRIFAATGTEDIAYPNLTPQIEAMKAFPEVFDFNEDYEQGNFHYLTVEGYYHTYPSVAEYVYNYMPYLFK